jgi:hypothetical protein
VTVEGDVDPLSDPEQSDSPTRALSSLKSFKNGSCHVALSCPYFGGDLHSVLWGFFWMVAPRTELSVCFLLSEFSLSAHSMGPLGCLGPNQILSIIYLPQEVFID